MNPSAYGKTVCSILAGLVLAGTVSAADISLTTGNGIDFDQVRYNTTTSGSETFQVSNTGLLGIDLLTLRESTGQTAGFINVSIGGDWLVRNVVIEEESVYPYSYLGAEFDLGSSMDVVVDELSDVAITYSDVAIEDISDITTSQSLSLDLALVDYSIGGVPDAPVNAAPSPPNMTDILFGDPQNTDAVTQFDHPNIEAARNQCMPASIANSLQFLENTTDLEIPHDNVAGLKGDNSLVGQLDTTTDRTVVSRFSAQNSGTWGIDGKLTYLAQNGLGGQIETTHMGSGANSGDSTIEISVGNNSATATGLGTDINFQTLLDAMKEGQDCELVYAWPNGAHAVDAVAAGVTNGEPWIVHGSDLDQTTDSAGGGPEGFRFEHLKDTDGDGQFNLSGTNKELVQVICEKYVPPPTDLSITGVDDPAGHSCCVTQPPSLLEIILNGILLTVNGTAPWLPMSGEVQADGTVELSSTATVAGFSNVANTFTGMYNASTNLIEDAQISLGTNGALPTGQPITYDVSLSSSAPASQLNPIIRGNGFRDDLLVDGTSPISLTVEFDAAGMAGTQADWWLVAVSDGVIRSFNLASGLFEDGLFPSFQGGLVNVPFTRFTLLPDGLGSGSHTFYFAVDTVPNGTVDEAQLTFDLVNINVR